MSFNRTVIQYYGSKARLANWIISHFPADHRSMVYCEPFVGAGSVFFSKPPVRAEIINDLEGNLIHFYRTCLKEPVKLHKALKRVLAFEKEWRRARNIMIGKIKPIDDIDRARAFWISVNLSFTHAPNCSTFAIRIDSDDNQHLYNSLTHLKYNWPHVLKRLKNAVIYNRDAFRVIKDMNYPQVLMYLDPPYYGSEQKYKCTFKKKEFEKLIDLLKDFKGKFILSTYNVGKIPANWKVVKKHT